MENKGFPDPNLIVNNDLNEPDLRFYDVRNDPFRVYGLYNYRTEAQFKRMPDSVAEATSAGVAALYQNTSGGRVRFSSDSDCIAIRAEMPGMANFPHAAFTGTAGFDLYLEDPDTGVSRYWRTFVPDQKSGGFSAKVVFHSSVKRYFTINFPTYSNVKNLYVGLRKNASLDAGLSYRPLDPIVYYGSSITQGGCASRPGNMYQNLVCRRFNMDYINLGFSGSAKGEDAIADYMATLPMSAFVSDYDHNVSGPEQLLATHRKLYEKIRAAHPDVPYLILTRPDFDSDPYYQRSVMRRKIIYDTYQYACDHGDKNVYFIDGESLFHAGSFSDSATVDGTHPNDYGFTLMANQIISTLEFAFTRKYLRRDDDRADEP